MLRKVLLLLATLTLSGCDSELVGTFGDMFAIRDAVLAITDADEVGVNIQNGAVLSVTITNSSLNADTPRARRALADRVARIAHARYSNRAALESIYVVFAAHEQKYVVVSMSATVEAFRYAPRALQSPPSDDSVRRPMHPAGRALPAVA